VDEQAERRELYNGFGNALALAMEFAVGPVLFGGLGWFFDRRLGWFPVLTIALGVLGVIASFLRMWYRYDADMRERESQAIWNTHASITNNKVGVGSASEQPTRERSGLSAQRTGGTA
jgi:F0F1-type ATP synthase assembly protein I